MELLTAQASEIEMLQKLASSQQAFCEQIQRHNLAKNVIISVIPKESIKYGGKELRTLEEKVVGI